MMSEAVDKIKAEMMDVQCQIDDAGVCLDKAREEYGQLVSRKADLQAQLVGVLESERA